MHGIHIVPDWFRDGCHSYWFSLFPLKLWLAGSFYGIFIDLIISISAFFLFVGFSKGYYIDRHHSGARHSPTRNSIRQKHQRQQQQPNTIANQHTSKCRIITVLYRQIYTLDVFYFEFPSSFLPSTGSTGYKD